MANLQPATLMGVESNGMVLAASHEGTLSLLTLDRDLPPGAKVSSARSPLARLGPSPHPRSRS